MKYNWDVCKGFIKKEREKGKLLISNTNNITRVSVSQTIFAVTHITKKRSNKSTISIIAINPIIT